MAKPDVLLRGGISAKVVAHSVANDTELVTFVLNYPRFIHSEFMTHRMFSRNASSSRAVPTAKLIQQVVEDCAYPIHWGMNQPGMQANNELPPAERYDATNRWVQASIHAAQVAEKLSAIGVHKQITNRILEPFQYIKVIVTATEWENFYELRLDKAAQPEMQELAHAMQQAKALSSPSELLTGEWHLPFVSKALIYDYDEDTAIKASVARCARVSYLNHDQSEPNLEKDIALHDILLEAGHMSPFEHIATPLALGTSDFQQGLTHRGENGSIWSGNFHNWAQYRQLL